MKMNYIKVSYIYIKLSDTFEKLLCLKYASNNLLQNLVDSKGWNFYW